VELREQTGKCPAGHTVYLSEMVADNAVTLHQFKHPQCTSIQRFSCGDHFHIGHPTKADKLASHPECAT
jgi:hypothetical protein